MCCFRRPVKSVSSTRIFAREAEDRSQFIVYQMSLEAKEDLAMVLPIPVDQSKGEQGVEFISLEEYPLFFADLEVGFHAPSAEEIGIMSLSLDRGEPTLKVYQVGDFKPLLFRR
jgi:hypothetical protein